jgi:AcrR family transcriptional regulator
MAEEASTTVRTVLSRDRVLRAAVSQADEGGIDAVSMRKLSELLGVVPMALYKHVANKDELLAGMVDLVIVEVEPPAAAAPDWRTAIRQRVLSARQVMLRHTWASAVIESRTAPTPVVLAYLDATMGIFLAGGFSVDLTHHVMHALGSRTFGFAQELFDDSASNAMNPEQQAAMLAQLAGDYPNLVQVAALAAHDPESVVGGGCDDQFEFEFALDLLLDGIERLHRVGWRSGGDVKASSAK